MTSLERFFFFIFWKKKTRWWTYWKTITHSLWKHFQEHFLAPKSKIIIKKKANKKKQMEFVRCLLPESSFPSILSPGWFCCLYGLGVCGCAQKYFSFLFSQSICGWMEETGEIKRRRKDFFFACECERRGEWIEANANPLLVCHYIVTFLYLQQSSGSFSSLDLLVFSPSLFFGWCLFFGIALFK